MKTKKYFVLIIITSFFFAKDFNAQTPTLTLSNVGMCINSVAYAHVSNQLNLPSLSYSWAIAALNPTNSCLPTNTVTDPFTGENILIDFPCAGIFQIFCNIYTGMTFITQITETISISSNSASIQPLLVCTNSSTTLCFGNIFTITASGNSNYSWSNSSTSNSVVATSTIGVNAYIVSSTFTNGCKSYNAQYIYGQSPSVYLFNSLSSNTICRGSSVNLYAIGANSYTWNSNPILNSNTFNTIPSNTVSGWLTYSVTGIDQYSCVASDTISIYIDANCAVVWPGDANRDSIVDNSDVFELGLNASSTGAARTPTNNSWIGITAQAWTGTTSTGWSLCHADCNGDGTVNADDTLAIYNNYSLNHTFKPQETSAGLQIQIVPQQSVANGGAWNKADIIIGDASNSLNQVYGISFDVDFSSAVMQPDSVKLFYTNAFINAGNQNINFRKLKFSSGKLYTTTVRTNHANVSGYGKIGELWYKLQSGLPNNSIVSLSTSNGKIINSLAEKTLFLLLLQLVKI